MDAHGNQKSIDDGSVLGNDIGMGAFHDAIASPMVA